MGEFEEYIRQGEKGLREKAGYWQTAIGLQDVDGLKPSPYLLDTARRHIEGDITIEEVKGLIDTYYKSKEGRLTSEEGRTEEADKVSVRITELLQEETFSFTPLACQSAIVKEPKCNIYTLNCTLEELETLRFLKDNPMATQAMIAEHIHRSERTVKSMTVRLAQNE